VSFDELKDSIKRAFPFAISDELAHDIVFSGSFIEFTSSDEVLFRAEDKVKGLYLVLSGKAVIKIPGLREAVWLEPGEMAGLDSFIINEKQGFEIRSASKKLRTLFIDKYCYKRLLEVKGFQAFVNYQLAKQILVYKKVLSSDHKLIVK